jgi:hypothetical protein
MYFFVVLAAIKLIVVTMIKFYGCNMCSIFVPFEITAHVIFFHNNNLDNPSKKINICDDHHSQLEMIFLEFSKKIILKNAPSIRL